MMIHIDAKGKNCPIPVVLTKKEIDKGAEDIVIEVDNEVAVENVTKLATSMGYILTRENTFGGFALNLSKNEKTETMTSSTRIESDDAAVGNWVLFASSDSLGSGERELGTSLMQMFFYTLSESDDLPSCILLMNEGVKLVTIDEETAVHMQKLVDRGVQILVCGTCLNYYHIAEQLKVGNVSNMYDIQEQMLAASKVITL